MFVLSQIILQKLNVCSASSLPNLAIVLGIIIYAGIYLYFMLSHKDLLPYFNKFVFYVIGLDLLLSTAYYFLKIRPQNTKIKQSTIDNIMNALDQEMSETTSEDEESIVSSETTEDHDDLLLDDPDVVTNEAAIEFSKELADLDESVISSLIDNVIEHDNVIEDGNVIEDVSVIERDNVIEDVNVIERDNVIEDVSTTKKKRGRRPKVQSN